MRQERRRNPDGPAGAAGGLTGHERAGAAPASVLVVSSDADWRGSVRGALGQLEARASYADSLGAAMVAMENEQAAFDLAVVDIDLPDGRGLDLVAAAHRLGMGVVMAARTPALDDAVAALRSGATDLLGPSEADEDLAQRIEGAIDHARAARRQRQRMARLKRMCRRLNSANRQVVRQVDSLCTDLVQAYEELAENMNTVSTAAEYNSLIRQELDIESLLRRTLEFVLARTGPTNAAVFLPTTSGDYSLGAYVNYDCPRDTADILLDHLANVVAPRFEESTEVEHLTDRASLDRYLGDDAQWLGDSHVIGFACPHEGECLAIVMLFRDSHTPYVPPLLAQLATVRDLFAAQLARVIHIHHRHLPKDKWGALGDPDGGRDDLAA